MPDKTPSHRQIESKDEEIIVMPTNPWEEEMRVEKELDELLEALARYKESHIINRSFNPQMHKLKVEEILEKIQSTLPPPPADSD